MSFFLRAATRPNGAGDKFLMGKFSSPVAYVALAGAVVLLAAPLLFGPWIPFIDLVSFVGMDSYPPELSYGPVHYATLQLTYVGHYFISRLLTDLRINVSGQIVFFYLVQAGVSFGVIWRLLERLVANPWLRACGVALGTVGAWDGMFIWGGPLAYSLAGMCLTIATFLAMSEAAENRAYDGIIAALVAFALLCHPFAAPFAIVLCFIRWWFVPGRRWSSVLISIAILVYALAIIHDTPPGEKGAAGQLSFLFGFRIEQVGNRCVELLKFDQAAVTVLFGERPFGLSATLFVLFGLRVIGFILSPVLVWKARDQIWVRMLAALNTIVLVLFLCSWDLRGTPIPEWPQRILTLYAPFTYLSGVTAISYLLQRLPVRPLSRRVVIVGWMLPVGILIAVFSMQASVFRLGDRIATNYHRVRDQVMKSGIKDAFVVVAGIDGIHPFYLRSVPFLLFSDPQIIARHILVSTEWHFESRHPSRLVENWFNLGRRRYLATFSSNAYVLNVALTEQPQDRFPIAEGTNVAKWGSATLVARQQFDEGGTLFNDGLYAAALEHYNTAIYLLPNEAAPWNDGGATLYTVGQFEEAARYFRKAVELDPKLAQAQLNLGRALIALKRPNEAVPYLEAAARLDPQDSRARDLIRKLGPQLERVAPTR